MPPKKSEKKIDSLLKTVEKRKKCIQKYRNNITKKNQTNILQTPIYTSVPMPVAEEETKETKEKRCPKGTRRNKKTGICEPVDKK